MDDFLFPFVGEVETSEQLFLAQVGSVSSAGATLQINGEAATATGFKHLVTGQSLAAGDLVLVARISGSYVILGKIAY